MYMMLVYVASRICNRLVQRESPTLGRQRRAAVYAIRTYAVVRKGHPARDVLIPMGAFMF